MTLKPNHMGVLHLLQSGKYLHESPVNVAKDEGRTLPSACFLAQNLSITDLLLLRGKANIIDPHGARDLAVQLGTTRPDHSYEQKASIGKGGEFSVLF